MVLAHSLEMSHAITKASPSFQAVAGQEECRMKSAASLSASVEDYLTAIYRLTSGGPPVGPSRLAEFMGLSVPSITVMMRRLADQGLVVKDISRGVALSSEGEEMALSIIRRHRLSECFLVEKLGFDWGQAHVEAHRFEHALSPEVADALDRFLGNPRLCPHGNPIPDALEPSVSPACLTLADLSLGDRVVVRSVDERSVDMLTWLKSMGLVPGAAASVSEVDPSGATMLLRVDQRWVACGAETARCVRVERLEES